MSKVCVAGFFLLTIGFACCPNEPQPSNRLFGVSGEIRDYMEKGVPLSVAQLAACVGTPDRVVGWAELDAMLKNEAGLADNEVGDQEQRISDSIGWIGHRYLHINEDITAKCSLLIYNWQHPLEKATWVSGTLFTTRTKGTFSTYYVRYNGEIIDFGFIHRVKPEYSN